MAVKGAHLVAAHEANLHRSWVDCRRYLMLSGQCRRGWVPFFRRHIQSEVPQPGEPIALAR